jgi:8-oxo-dGTP pyrophosphatase MutT (NUDIX family)
VIDDLRGTLPGRPRRVLDLPGRAAVLVPILDDEGPLRLLLTRRTEGLPTHQGQVAFPGGFVLPEDRDPIRTALREAEEEIGLPPAAVEVLGMLDDLPTRSGSISVTPVVGRIGALPALRPEPAEVARIFSIPIAELLDGSRWTSKADPSPSGPRRVHFFFHEGETLWGLSARIVLHLLDLTPAGSPVDLAGS